METPTDAVIAEICRYPVKGLTGQSLQQVDLTAGEGLPLDRHFAIAHGASQFDPREPRWHPRQQFLMLARNARLATLETSFDAATGVLTIRRSGRQVARGDITTPLGRVLVNQFLAAYMGEEGLGAPKIVEAPGVMFTDCEEKLVSLINLASLRDIERVARAPVEAARFRGNLMLEGLAPWAEFTWVDREIAVGDARLQVVERITRCAATEVNPRTGERDLNVPRLLRAGFGHVECGVYARVTTAGTVRRGDAVVPV